jgi:DNA polymerase-4/protein ImuB
MAAACLQVPNFLIALARRDHPDLAKRPVVVGGAPEEHAQVTACSAEAAAAGVTIGTSLRRALALCPNAVFLPLQEAFAHTEAARLADVILGRSPLVEIIAPGHMHFEVRGLARIAGMSDEQYLAELLESVQAETGLGVWLGAATTVFPAHAAATALPLVGATASHPLQPAPAPKGGWVLVPPGQEREFLAHLPVEVLPVDPVMHVRLRLFGLERIGQVAAIPLSALQAQFGPDGRRAWDLANGRDTSRIVARREEARITEEMDLPAPAASIEPLMAGTEALLNRALAHPDVRGQAIRQLDWWLGLESGEQVARRVVFREPTSDARHMLFVLRSKLDRLALDAAATSVGITLSGICSEYAHQANLWQVGPRRQRELEQAIAQLSARTGGPQVYRIVEVQPWSRIPERQLALVAFGS